MVSKRLQWEAQCVCGHACVCYGVKEESQFTAEHANKEVVFVLCVIQRSTPTGE